MNQETKKNKIFIYKLVAENGGAPCVHKGMMSLCLCKPHIRQTAEKNDWIIGMGGRDKRLPELNDRLIYIMRVTDKIQGKDYYAPKSKYWSRPDCVYKYDDGKYSWKKGSKYHSKSHLKNDLGEQDKYERALCLVGNHFVYFGNGEKKNPSIDLIKDIYNGLPRDYRKNHQVEIYNRLDKYIENIFNDFGKGTHGEPTHKLEVGKCGECHKTEGEDEEYCAPSC